jgi:hypothetical protein
LNQDRRQRPSSKELEEPIAGEAPFFIDAAG